MSNEFMILLGCVCAVGLFGLLWYAMAGDTDNWDE